MENKKQNFHRTITVNASASEVMKKISQVDGWWVNGFSGKTEQVNDKFHVPMGTTYVDFQVTEHIPNKRAVWKVTNSHIPWLKDVKEWNNTEVVFDLSEKENATQIDFTHVGLTPDVECYDACQRGWTEHVVDSLVKFINEGKGTPKQFK